MRIKSNLVFSTVLIISLMACELNAVAQLKSSSISRSQATSDLTFYYDLIDKQHGNPYAYISSSDFQSQVNRAINSLPETLNPQEFSNLLTRLNEHLKCGHTTVNLNTQWLKSETEKSNFFPYPLTLIDNQLFLDFEGTEIPLGSKIQSINKIQYSKLIEELAALVVADGFIETKKLREVEQKFGYYYFLKYGPSSSFEVAYTFGDSSYTTTVKGIAGHQMMANQYKRPVYQSHERYYHFTHLDAVDSLQTLVLTLNTFQANPEWFYQKISSQYDEAAKSFKFNHLVFDLRDNEGGDRRLLALLYQLVAGKKFSDPSQTYTRSIAISNEEQLVGINGAVNSAEVIANAENYLQQHFQSQGNGKYAGINVNWQQDFDLDYDFSNLSFEGDVYVLTSGKTFSAAADLARILSNLDNVTLVGEETGGAHNARTANMLLNYSLPNSGLMVQIPVIFEEFVNKDENNGKGRGTFPDYLVVKTYQDLIDKKDAVFEFTLDLIAQSNAFGSN